MSIKIVVADDHHLNRRAFVLMLQMRPDFEVCAEAGTGSEAIRAVQMHKPHILLLDLQMPGMNGFEVLEKLKGLKLKVKTIIVSGYDSEENMVRCVQQGACGFLSKDAQPGEECTAIESVMQSGIYFKDEISMALLKETIRLAKFKPCFHNDTLHFDSTEMLVLYHYCCQLSNTEIGEKIFGSERTVEGIKARMIKELKAINFTGVVIYCHQKRLIDLDSIPLRIKSKAA